MQVTTEHNKSDKISKEDRACLQMKNLKGMTKSRPKTETEKVLSYIPYCSE